MQCCTRVIKIDDRIHPMRTASGGQGIRRLRRANLPWSAPVTIRRRRGAKFAVRPQSEILLSSRVDVVSRARLIV